LGLGRDFEDSRSGAAAAQISAIGAFSEVILGYFERPTKAYKQIPIREQVEVLSLSGQAL